MSTQETIRGIREQLKAIKEAISIIEFNLSQLESGARSDASWCGMYPLTIGLAIENSELRDQAQSCLANLPFRVTVDHEDIAGDLANFLYQLERMRPDVVLIDISSWKEPEGLVSSIRNAIGDPIIIALLNAGTAETILAALRAGVHEVLFPPLQESLRRALEKRSRDR